MKRVLTLLSFSLLLSLPGCSSLFAPRSSGGEAVTIDSLRGAAPYNRLSKTITVARELYVAALEREGSINEARLVEIFHRGVPNEEIKEYRLLDVRPGSVYDLLGLRHNDVLVAADNYVIPTAPAFWGYLQLIAGFEKATIELRREGRPVLFTYKFVERLP